MIRLKHTNYYVTANTAEGFINHLTPNLHGIKETIRLDNQSYKMNTAILQQLFENNKAETVMEVLKSPISGRYLDGLIFREKQIAILGNQDCPFTTKAYDHFKKGLRIHDDLEKLFIQEMDFAKADKLAETFTKELLADQVKRNQTPHVYRRFFGTNTMDGIVNEVPNLTEPLEHVYHIKGRAGTGKSTFMKKIANACLEYGLDLQIYRCSFDPNSIDMVLVPELGICLFDSTDPHEFEPRSSKEHIIDLYEEAVTPGTDEKYAKEISELTKEYKSYMKKGLAILKEEGAAIVKADDDKTFSQAEVTQIASQLQNILR